MEKITATCPACGQSYLVGREIIGKRVQCRNCPDAFIVPQPLDDLIDDVPELAPSEESNNEVPAHMTEYLALANAPPSVERMSASDMADVGIRSVGVIAIPICLAFVAMVVGGMIGYGLRDAAQFIAHLVSYALAICGIAYIAYSIWVTIIPFHESVNQGLLCLIPFYWIYYCASRWDDMERPFFIRTAMMVVMCFLLAVMGGLVAE